MTSTMRKARAVAVIAGLLTSVMVVLYLRVGNPIDAWQSYRCAERFMSYLRGRDYDHAAEMYDPRTIERFVGVPKKLISNEWPAIREYRFAGFEHAGEFAIVTFSVVADTVDRMAVTVRHSSGQVFVTVTDPPGI